MALCRDPRAQDSINQGLKQFLRKDPPNLRKPRSAGFQLGTMILPEQEVSAQDNLFFFF